MKKLITSIVVAGAAVCGSMAALAQTPPEVRTEVVRFADLDTSRIEGATALYRRLQIAARDVCRDLQPTSALPRTQYKACVQSAIDRAVLDVNRPVVTAYAMSRGSSKGAAPITIASGN